MLCECGGVFLVEEIEEDKEGEILDRRLCNVTCSECGKKLYGQPYDFGKRLNVISNNTKFRKV